MNKYTFKGKSLINFKSSLHNLAINLESLKGCIFGEVIRQIYLEKKEKVVIRTIDIHIKEKDYSESSLLSISNIEKDDTLGLCLRISYSLVPIDCFITRTLESIDFYENALKYDPKTKNYVKIKGYSSINTQILTVTECCFDNIKLPNENLKFSYNPSERVKLAILNGYSIQSLKELNIDTSLAKLKRHPLEKATNEKATNEKNTEKFTNKGKEKLITKEPLKGNSRENIRENTKENIRENAISKELINPSKRQQTERRSKYAQSKNNEGMKYVVLPSHLEKNRLQGKYLQNRVWKEDNPIHDSKKCELTKSKRQ